MKKILACLFLLFTIPAYAADNSISVTVGSGVVLRSKDIGAGVQSSINIIGDVTGNPIYGTAGTANANVLTIQGIASGTAVPVSLASTTITGTVAATQSGTWNITNISGTITLPTGASTAAKQPALGTAGTASTDVITVQGIASMTPFFVSSGIGPASTMNSASASAGINAALAAVFDDVAPTSITENNFGSVRMSANRNLYGTIRDAAGNERGANVDAGNGLSVSFGTAFTALTGWTSGTALNATQTLMTTTNGAPAILLQLNQTSTISAGASTLEGTYDGSNWVSIPVAQIVNPNTFANLTNPYTLVASTNQPFLILTQGYQGVRIKLSTQITGSATVTPNVTLLNYNPTIGALLNPLVAGSAIIGNVRLDQTTPGTTNGVAINGINGATALAGNGATGTGAIRVTISNDNTLPTGWASSVAQASTTSGQTGSLIQGAVTTSAPTYTTAQTSPLSLTTTGGLRVDNATIVGNAISTGSGVMGTGTQRMALATDSPGIVTLGQTTKSASVPMAIASDQVGTAGTANATVTTVQGIASMTPIIANSTNGYPTGAIAETASTTGTTAATTATLATAVGKTTYICGFSIRANATAAATANATVTGTITGTLNFTQWTAPLASGIGLNEQLFTPCVPASATNTSIAVVSAAPGSGGVVSVTAWGFQL